MIRREDLSGLREDGTPDQDRSWVPPGVRLVRAGPEFSSAVSFLHAACFDEPWSAFTVRQVLSMPQSFGLVAVPDDHAAADLLGFALARCCLDECELLSLAVAEAHRGSGVGGALLAHAMILARRMGTRRIFLEVAEDNEGAQRLYRRFGFARIGRRPDYYRRPSGPPMAALTLACALKGEVGEGGKGRGK